MTLSDDDLPPVVAHRRELDLDAPSHHAKRPPRLSSEERERRRAGWSPVHGFEKPEVWLHDLFGPVSYRWLRKNVLMRNDEHGIEIGYRPRRAEDVICGATTVKPGDPNGSAPWWFPADVTKPYDVGCTILGDHPDLPHIGVPLACAEQTCSCSRHGSYHLVITSLVIGRQVEANGAERWT